MDFIGEDFSLSRETVVSQQTKNRYFSKSLAHYIVGLVYDNENQRSRAITEYRKALKYDKDSALIRLRIGTDLIVMGDNKRAIRELEAAKKLDPSDTTANFILAVAYTSSGDFDAAQKQYESVIKDNLKTSKHLSLSRTFSCFRKSLMTR
jgi:Tfp pilus assembly protein PilF